MLGALLLVAAAFGACGICSAAAGTANAQQARWVQRKLYFAYLGFTTHYSCEGLRDRVKFILLQLGARPHDMKVYATGCTALLGVPERFPAVAGTFYVLEPAADGKAGASGGPTVQAHWETVDVRTEHHGEPGVGGAGQCELLEQVKAKILPLFPARNVQFQSNCVPHQLMLPGAALQVQVLKPDGKSGSHGTHAG